jgi:hypothetical protein
LRDGVDSSEFDGMMVVSKKNLEEDDNLSLIPVHKHVGLFQFGMTIGTQMLTPHVIIISLQNISSEIQLVVEIKEEIRV